MSEERKQLLWRLLQPAIVAMIVALLVAMGVEMTRPPTDGVILPAGITHFSSVYSNDDVEAVDDLIAGDDLTLTDDITCDDITADVLTVAGLSATNNLTLTGAFAGSSTGSFASELTASNGITVGGNITVGASLLTVSSAGALASASTGSFASELTASNGITVGGAITVGNSVATVSSAGALAVSGNVSDQGGTFRINDNTLITGTLGVSSLVSPANGLSVTSNVTATGTITTQAEVQVGTFINWAQCSAMTVTDGATFTPTHTYQQLTAAAWVSPTLSTSGYTAGDLLCLVNAGTNNIYLNDTGTNVLTAVWTAGQHDVLCLLFDGTNWVEISRANN